MLKGIALVALVTGAAETIQVPGWAYMVFTLIGAGGLFRFFMLRTERRLSDAGASKTEAEAREIEDRVRVGLMKEVEQKMQTARREAEHARTLEAEAKLALGEAQAEVARMVVEHQRDREAWREERHTLVNNNKAALDAKDLEIAALKAEIAELREQLRTLEIRLGYAEGRRDEDGKTQGRMAVLEDRADRSEAKADTAQHVADEQAARNDETPGHA